MKRPAWLPRRRNRTELTRLDMWLNMAATTLRRTSSAFSFGVSPDGTRDYNALFGYGVDLDYADYFGMYARGGIARTLIEKLPKACWRDVPTIQVGSEDNPTDILVGELEVLRNQGLFKALERADILNRIGNFSVLFIGVPDGLEVKESVGSGGALTNTYFNPYSYDGINISGFEKDPMSVRFGRPSTYNLQTAPQGLTRKDAATRNLINVDWSRIVHMAEGALDSSVEGSAALQPGWNTLIDLQKFRGSSAESYYRGSRQRTELRANENAQIDKSAAGLAAFQAQVAAWHNGYEDFFRTENMEMHGVDVTLESPRDGFDICIEELAGIYSMPVRVLTGKGGGQFLGAEDRASWNTLIADRQLQECTSWLLRALGVFNDAGMLELPDDARVKWPVNPVLNESEQADVTEKRAGAVKSVADAVSTVGGSEIVIESALREIGLEDIELEEDIDE